MKSQRFGLIPSPYIALRNQQTTAADVFTWTLSNSDVVSITIRHLSSTVPTRESLQRSSNNREIIWIFWVELFLFRLQNAEQRLKKSIPPSLRSKMNNSQPSSSSCLYLLMSPSMSDSEMFSQRGVTSDCLQRLRGVKTAIWEVLTPLPGSISTKSSVSHGIRNTVRLSRKLDPIESFGARPRNR